MPGTGFRGRLQQGTVVENAPQFIGESLSSVAAPVSAPSEQYYDSSSSPTQPIESLNSLGTVESLVGDLVSDEVQFQQGQLPEVVEAKSPYSDFERGVLCDLQSSELVDVRYIRHDDRISFHVEQFTCRDLDACQLAHIVMSQMKALRETEKPVEVIIGLVRTVNGQGNVDFLQYPALYLSNALPTDHLLRVGYPSAYFQRIENPHKLYFDKNSDSPPEAFGKAWGFPDTFPLPTRAEEFDTGIRALEAKLVQLRGVTGSASGYNFDYEDGESM